MVLARAQPDRNRGRRTGCSAAGDRPPASHRARVHAYAVPGAHTANRRVRTDNPIRKSHRAKGKLRGGKPQTGHLAIIPRPRPGGDTPRGKRASRSRARSRPQGERAESSVQHVASLFTRAATAGLISAVTAEVFNSPAPVRAIRTIALSPGSSGRSASRKLSRKRRLIRLRTTALPTVRETVSPSRGSNWPGTLAIYTTKCRVRCCHPERCTRKNSDRRCRRCSGRSAAWPEDVIRAAWLGSRLSADDGPCAAAAAGRSCRQASPCARETRGFACGVDCWVDKSASLLPINSLIVFSSAMASRGGCPAKVV